MCLIFFSAAEGAFPRARDFKKAAKALNVATSATSGLSGSSRQLPVKRIQNALLEKSLGLLGAMVRDTLTENPQQMAKRLAALSEASQLPS